MRLIYWLDERSGLVAALAGVVVAIFTGVLWDATHRLWLASKEQGGAMERSIHEAARAALAMEGLARAMQANVENTTTIIQQQRRLSISQQRAYISVLIGGARYQTDFLRFEGSPRLMNTGFTPAFDLRTKAAAAILPVPLPDDFKFPLPKVPQTGGNILGSQRDGTITAVVPERVPDDQVFEVKCGITKSLYVWGYVSYRDIFRRRHITTFAHIMQWTQTGEMSQDWRPVEIINGRQLLKHNRAN